MHDFHCAISWFGQPCTQNNCLSYKHGYFRDSLQMVKTMPPKRKMKETGDRKEKANSARRYMVEEKGKIDRQSKGNLPDEYERHKKGGHAKKVKAKKTKSAVLVLVI